MVNRDPRRRNRLRRWTRQLLSHAPRLGLVPTPDRPPGISAFVRVRDEADWIGLSLASLQGFADEIVVVDNGSTDGTLERLREARDRSPVPVQVHEAPGLPLVEVSNRALDGASFAWAFKWDGDFVGHTTGPLSLANLRQRVLDLDRRRYFVVYLRLVDLAGDLEHQDTRHPVHFEEYLHTRSAAARFVHDGPFEAIRFPKHYGTLFWYEPYVFHVNVKPARRLFLRSFFDEWLQAKDDGRFPQVEDLARSRIGEDYGVDSWDEAQRLFFRDYARWLAPYDQGRFGDLPALLQEAARDPVYRLLAQDGRVVGRNDVGRFE